MIIKSIAFEIGKKSFKNTFEHICFKRALNFENYKIWKCVFNKIYSFLCYLKFGCIIYEWYRPIYNKNNNM
jgi:hypothetical protein